MWVNHPMVTKGQWRAGNEWNFTQKSLLVFIYYEEDDRILTSNLKQITNKKFDTLNWPQSYEFICTTIW